MKSAGISAFPRSDHCIARRIVPRGSGRSPIQIRQCCTKPVIHYGLPDSRTPGSGGAALERVLQEATFYGRTVKRPRRPSSP